MHDGVARHVGVPASIMVGSPKGDTSAEDMVIDAFSASGISAAVSPDIILTLWEKFLLAASLGSVGAAMGIPAGQVLAMAGGSKLLRDAMAEIVALARHRGVNLGMEHVSAAFEFIGTFPEEATTSLQRDLAAGRASEFDALSAAVPRLAAASDFPVEVFPRLLRLIAANSVT
jgi:2-dehydropantoate 2-reductase